MATQQQSFAPSYFLLWSRGARAELERLDMEKKRLVYDTYFTLGITWESANPFTCTSSQWSGGKDIPVECRTHQYVTEALLYLYYCNYAKLQGSCPFVPAFIHCVNVAKRGGGAVALGVREREREREKRSEHTTLCTQNPDPPPYNKIDGIRWDHVPPLTVQLNSYGARYALAGVGSAKCQASLHQSAAMTSSSSL